ncbi:MAG: hypothetical protein D6E12_13770 [Desulfovibrio sp.]|mgnify:CR=1 FL=1|nr:MAG: hypothetical protein D6E12_13770 [Desulfovibrio sp.]
MKMLDLLDKEQWLAFELELHHGFGMSVSIFDETNTTFTGRVEFCNDLCPRIKSEPKGLQAICAVANQSMTAMARQERSTIIEQCDAGLAKICVPVFNGEDMIGTVSGCGRLEHGEEVDTFLIHKALECPEQEIVDLVGSVPSSSMEEIEAFAREVEKRIQALVQARQ